jgi:hypothetical protein
VQSVHESDRIRHKDHGEGVVVRIFHESTRGLGGAALCEALCRFDVGGLMCECIDDLREENDDERTR